MGSQTTIKGGGKRGHNVADTLLRTQMFPRLPVRATFVADTKFVSETQTNVSDFCQKHFVSATNVSPFTRHGHKTNVLCPARLPTQETS